MGKNSFSKISFAKLRANELGEFDKLDFINVGRHTLNKYFELLLINMYGK